MTDAIQTQAKVLSRSSRSVPSSLRNLISARISDFDQASFSEVVQKIKQVALAITRIHLVLLKQPVMDLVDRTRLLDQIPYRRSNGIETVIRAAAQVKDHCVTVQGTGNLVPYSRYSPSLGGQVTHIGTHCVERAESG